MRPSALLALFVPALVPILAFAAPDVKAPSRIDTVTVYRQSARVLRVARLQLPAGPARVVVEGLPLELDDDSIRVQGQGAAKARLFGVTVEQVTAQQPAAEEARTATERIERLGDEDRVLQDRIRAAQARSQFVESLRSTYSEERAKNLAVRGVSPKEWAELAGFVERELTAAAAQVREAEAARRELARRVTQARAELEKVQAKRGQTTKSVAIEVEAERSGAFELAVSYAVPSAGWEPIWDARLAPETSTMELSFRGSVWQRTGEDWPEVKLAVSTAQPARGLHVPQLAPVYLSRFVPPSFGYAQKSYGGRGAPSAAPMAPMAQERAVAADMEEPQVAMEVVTASVEQGLLSATFSAPRRESVDGSGQARKVALASFPLKAELVRTAAPRVESAAFLTAKATNDTGFPLLAGVAGVYVGDEFAGRAPLPFTPPGGEIELAFGADERVEVDRKVLERRRETAGVLSKEEVYRYRVRIGVKNRYAAQVAVKLLDLVPVSRDEKIKVALLDGTTAATRDDPERPGVRVYELALAPKEERVVELRYEVRYPRGFPVAGLE
jgi:uncharacterized protein (TIGR02231 family)